MQIPLLSCSLKPLNPRLRAANNNNYYFDKVIKARMSGENQLIDNSDLGGSSSNLF